MRSLKKIQRKKEDNGKVAILCLIIATIFYIMSVNIALKNKQYSIAFGLIGIAIMQYAIITTCSLNHYDLVEGVVRLHKKVK